ncbi:MULTISPECIES: NAD-glutamate dehydrogenase domain-containing protein [unclassified Rhodococcus (in: high G+C Gram-positive bacteria)]|uniref:NAD-glutamate dehydrogenase domain-containing protein n=1 Tax=unclassified Rhodococcus (in: high G+C Gram-positive bacteria) TaxID=192944 RepID=UPI0015C67789|nr:MULTISPECIES: NAD-glutamate dehydrogenase domain-containing protein [unclassified Rhodococcus (in: high G+C Gram-positive bacteria)]
MTDQTYIDEARISKWARSVREHAHSVPADALDDYLGRIPASLVDDCAPTTAAADLVAIHKLERGGISVHIGSELSDKETGQPTHHVRIRTIDSAAPLHRVLPILQSMGIDAVDERPYLLNTHEGYRARIYDLTITMPTAALDSIDVTDLIADAFRAAWFGHLDIDSFNKLILTAGLTWRQVTIVRAYSAYLHQAGLPYTRTHIQSVLAAHPGAAMALVQLFETRLDPRRAGSVDQIQNVDDAAARIIETVAGLDADRILSSLLTTIRATTRTNMYSAPRPRKALSIKLDADAIDFLPKPRPRVEAFVFGSDVHGVHMRFDAIARGGIRYSDRPDDFRTEILGLAKAQSVKNAVIVPAGAKGGFVVNRPDPGPEQIRRCYREFIASLLDLTDNLAIEDGTVVPAPGVIRRDQDDTYFVVAADKGTASFSDLANEVALERGYWLGDAFASGGTVGYDHKAMGITARGAWESVTRHFREIGIDIVRDTFSVIGIGDMSGDVFGNGMLLSDKMALIAAFDHRHIFIDPTPDPTRSFTERLRLFELPTSSWNDYDRSMLSEGGLIVSRTAKAVRLTPQIRATLAIDPSVTQLSAQDLVRAVLAAPADLLWNGGIGTYVKASTESHLACGDKANDGVRIDADQLRVKVVGEGGNLGITQRGRIQFARAGGHINTDALDNAGGVDCSDHEVNIKIALAPAQHERLITDAERAELLVAMTDDVSAAVLAENKSQNDLMGSNRYTSASMIGFHSRIVEQLEADGIVDRDVDNLPTAAEFAEMSTAGTGLTSPELAQLTAQVKNGLRRPLLDSAVPDEPPATERLMSYFPLQLTLRFADSIEAHPLRREIATSALINTMVEYGGISFVSRLRDDTASTVADCARAFEIVNATFGLDSIYAATHHPDSGIPADGTNALVGQTQRLLDRASRWFLTRRSLPLTVADDVARYRENIRTFGPVVRRWLRDDELEAVQRRTAVLVSHGAPESQAARVADLLHIYCFLDITDLAAALDSTFAEVAELYFAVSAHLHINTHLTNVSGLDRRDRWHSLARLSLREDLYTSLRAITADIARNTSPAAPTDARLIEWEEANASTLESTRILLAEATAGGAVDGDRLANLCVAARQIRVMGR